MSPNQDRTSSLPFSSVVFYLAMIPLFFVGSLHYMECKNKSLVHQLEAKVNTDMTTVKYLLANSAELRKHLPFYSEDNKYTAVTITNDAFNYTLPLLGQKEFKLIKGKEENIFKSPQESLYSVNYVDLRSRTCWSQMSFMWSISSLSMKLRTSRLLTLKLRWMSFAEHNFTEVYAS
jgi:hypothetical protein